MKHLILDLLDLASMAMLCLVLFGFTLFAIYGLARVFQ